MKKAIKEVIVILGQTSTGKSDLAVLVAKKVNGLNQFKKLVGRTSQGEVLGEVISADSRQVYKGLDLGTGKITKQETQNIKHHLLNVANAKNKFNVSDFKKLADEKIEEIIARGKVPIICGGTGFYIDAVVNGIIFPEVPPNNKLRKILEKKNVTELFTMLKKIDKNRARDIDKNNKIRLIRAIEIAKFLGKVPKVKKTKPKYEFTKIGLYVPTEILKERIYTRLLARIDAGMIREVKNLHKKGLSWKRMGELGLEYRHVALYLQKKLTKEEMIQKLNSEIYKFAKRQMTWFKRDKEIKWLDSSKKIQIKNLF